jgi:hypothetical protein
VKKEVRRPVKKERNILHTVNRRKERMKEGRLGDFLHRNGFLKHVFEGDVEGKIDVNKRRRRRRKQPLNDLKETRGYCELKEEALHHKL